jgi:hypothetical protein
VPPANYVHPEFGYLCPTSRLRRDFRVAVVSIVLGGIIGAIVVTLRAGYDRSDSAMMVARVEHPAETAPATAPEAVQGATDVGNPKHEAIKPEAIKPEAVRTERMRIDAVKADVAEPVTDGAKTERSKTERAKTERANTDGTKTDGSKIDGAKTQSVKADSVKTDGTKADATKSTCEDNTWSYLDGTCVAGKPRRVKVRAATDNPAIGAAPLGRTVSTSVAAPAPAAAIAPQSSAAAATPSNAATPAETSQPSAAAVAKKPQKVVRSQSRASDRSVRDERANYSSARGYAGYANAPGPYRQGPNQGYFGWYW